MTKETSKSKPYIVRLFLVFSSLSDTSSYREFIIASLTNKIKESVYNDYVDDNNTYKYMDMHITLCKGDDKYNNTFY